MRIKFTSTAFLQELRDRIDRFSSVRAPAARLSVPADMVWWYWQEFGTATHNEQTPSGGYPIAPIPPNRILSWPDAGHPGTRVFTFFVPRHPGFRPQAFVRSALPDIQSYAAQSIGQALLAYDPAAVQLALVSDVLPYAKQQIVAGMNDTLRGTRPDGKLEDRRAGDVFNERATISQTSE